MLLGETLLKAGRPGEAEAPLRTAAAVLEGDAQPLLLLRDVYSHMGRWRDVIDVFSKLSYLVTTPRARAELEYRIGEVHRTRLGDPDAAAQHFARGYDIDPRHLPTLRRLVVRYAETARDRDALDVFVELWRLDAAAARRGDVLWHAACAAARLGEPEAVEAALAQTNREAPDQPGPLLAMARLAAGSDPERASASLRTALQLGAGADDLARLARELAGDPAVLPQARTAAQAALALRPADVQALSVLVDAARQMGDLAGAARAQGVLAFVDPSAAPPTFDAPRVLGEEEREAFLDPPGQSSLAIAIRHSRHAFRPGTGETTVPGIPIGPDGDPAVAEPLSQARLLVGGPDVEPYLLDDPSTGLALQGGEVPRLLFGGDFGELPEGERLWLVARSLIRVTTGEGLIERVDPAEILGRLRALRRALVGARVDDDARELLERSAAAMSASDRIVVAQALDRGLQDATPEMVARVVEALHLFANRAALVATRDVTSALTALARAENDGELPSTAAERAQIVQGSRALTDLVAFALTTPQ